MKLWLILIVPETGVRWTDTAWVSLQSAESRKKEIENAWKLSGNHPQLGHKIYVMEGQVQDATMKGIPPR